MVRVQPTDEPGTFDATVRQPGLRALAEMVGEPSGRTVGRKFKKIAATRDEIPAGAFPPYWREAIDDLLSSYKRLCAYLCLYIPRGTGAPSVDHMLAKSTKWDRVYEWNNYRLACSLMNSRKGAAAEVLDPFEIEDGWFALELVEFQLVPREGIPTEIVRATVDTIDRLRLNDRECCDAREEFAVDYWKGHIDLDYLTRHALFVARELRRQGRLHQRDS